MDHRRGERLGSLLAEIRHPIRLPILLALADEQLSPSQLADRLGVPLDTVVYAVRALHRAGLIELVRVEPAGVGENTVRRVYRSLRPDWHRVAEVLDDFVPPEPPAA
ncbi:MAG TPA: winged helix-turn-helix domain-containing protein [Baekduia sp.]|uniref:winged helix-turn-helix domain-containing protein n=1 Tax=Baekduia sp. TaxID=2600305 RepID=UPI002D0A4C32|nr:winged helix-turn-helix domain-containing protein [Baekduia sp.]HMJ34128.1 winged helix-turn-helix domain-containing protein [Baekduia sp.]